MLPLAHFVAATALDAARWRRLVQVQPRCWCGIGGTCRLCYRFTTPSLRAPCFFVAEAPLSQHYSRYSSHSFRAPAAAVASYTPFARPTASFSIPHSLHLPSASQESTPTILVQIWQHLAGLCPPASLSTDRLAVGIPSDRARLLRRSASRRQYRKRRYARRDNGASD